MKPALTREEGLKLIQEINNYYSIKEDIIETLDDFMYALFYLDTDGIDKQKQQSFAFMIRNVKKAIISLTL